jgi:hypothetical protein
MLMISLSSDCSGCIPHLWITYRVDDQTLLADMQNMAKVARRRSRLATAVPPSIRISLVRSDGFSKNHKMANKGQLNRHKNAASLAHVFVLQTQHIRTVSPAHSMTNQELLGVLVTFLTSETTPCARPESNA